MIRGFILLCLVITLQVNAQSEMKTKQAFLFHPHYAHQIPGGDLKKRFNPFSSIGMGVDFKFKNNWMVGLDYDWFFGNSVIDNGLFSGISGPSGQIIDKNGDFSVMQLNMKGNYVTLNASYLINIPKNEAFSGIIISGGLGVMQHKVDILSAQTTIPQVNSEYEKGYDKLTYGLAIKEFIGYQYSVSKNRYRFRGGIEFNQGFTKGRRTWDFNANKSGLDKRFDTTVAMKIGFIVPVYTKNSEDEEFFLD
ncbi:hypothetical protein OAD66_05080 [Bacteroidia bacterium]|nr:hypothetical protein [Bacteroidia bacterium]MDB4107041.1 hypothetical protein [Bacteroidia bacterium]MDB9882489.1 hypothetical protein [Bacteroidia bacterium]